MARCERHGKLVGVFLRMQPLKIGRGHVELTISDQSVTLGPANQPANVIDLSQKRRRRRGESRRRSRQWQLMPLGETKTCKRAGSHLSLLVSCQV